VKGGSEMGMARLWIETGIWLLLGLGLEIETRTRIEIERALCSGCVI